MQPSRTWGSVYLFLNRLIKAQYAPIVRLTNIPDVNAIVVDEVHAYKK